MTYNVCGGTLNLNQLSKGILWEFGSPWSRMNVLLNANKLSTIHLLSASNHSTYVVCLYIYLYIYI